jgi:hypothetical protein
MQFDFDRHIDAASISDGDGDVVREPLEKIQLIANVQRRK